MIISFGWTAQYLPPRGCKDATRRLWSDRTFNSWLKAWDEGRLIHDAVNKQLCYGGERIGKVEMIERPFLQFLYDMPDSDLIREGGMVNTVQEYVDTYFKGDFNLRPAVIRFNFTPNE